MATTKSNSVTKRLEGFARARGYECGVVVSEGNASGRFFVVNENGKPLVHWRRLGWTADEARESLAERIALFARDA
jgi:hypothetical protein